MTAAPLAPGTRLKGRYEIIRLLKGGGMSWVYEAREHRPDATTHIWALKELRMDANDRHTLSEAKRLFEQEARLLVQLDHPNLPKVAAFFSEGERSYLVMEFVHGETLLERLTRAGAPLLESQVILWAIQICDVLDYLHTRQPPIIFRDVKPGNIMVTPDGKIKLIDFGIARTYKVGQLRDTITMGSENYAAPEQWGQAQTDPRSDLYSLGATLYHLLANEPPLPAYVPGNQKPLLQHNPAVSAELAAVIERAMAFERGDRFRSAAEMRAALLRCLPWHERLLVLRTYAGSHPPSQKEEPTHWAQEPPPLEPAAAFYCRACGAANRNGARFCRRCGKSLQQAARARLVLIGQTNAPPYALSTQTVVLGRSTGVYKADIDLGPYDPEGYISRRHAQISFADGRFWITDLGSANGTYVNGRPLQTGHRIPLRYGDRIRLAQLEMTFERG